MSKIFSYNRPILVTGSTGFIGCALCKKLFASGADVRALVRDKRKSNKLPSTLQTVQINPITSETDWSNVLTEIDTVIHLGARVHVMEEKAANPLNEFRLVNVESTVNLARQAAYGGVARFVFISSIKVNGEETICNRPFTEYDVPAPEDPYGISKCEAEDKLNQLAIDTGMEVVIIRPPLVYGPGVKGNFQKLLYWVDKQIPLPFGSITNNKRSFVALDNLIDLILTCVENSAAANQTFLVSDDEDLSTAELLQRVALAIGRPSRLLPVPIGILQRFAALLGKQTTMHRLCGSLQVDISKAKNILGWTPPITVDEGLRRVISGGL